MGFISASFLPAYSCFPRGCVLIGSLHSECIKLLNLLKEYYIYNKYVLTHFYHSNSAALADESFSHTSPSRPFVGQVVEVSDGGGRI